MSIERAEQLKEKLTDKFVVVDQSIPELRRFANWTGKVKTVNMSCRALVEFDGPVDIGWYDINPDYLIVVDGPKPKAAPAAKAPAAAAGEAKPAAKPAATGGKSPLDAIRAQQAAKAGGAPAAPAAAVGAKPSPLDMIRKQGAAKAKPAEAEPAPAVAEQATAAAVPEPAPAAPAPAPAKPALPTTGPDGKPLSKIDLIRMQGAKKS